VDTGLAAGQRRGGDQSADHAAVGRGADHAAGPPSASPCARSLRTGAANGPYRPVSRLGARIEASRDFSETPAEARLGAQAVEAVGNERVVVRRRLQTDLGRSNAWPRTRILSRRLHGGSCRLVSARVGSRGSVWVGSRRTGVKARLQPRSEVSVRDAARPEGVGQTWLDRLASFGGWSTQKTPHCMRAGSKGSAPGCDADSARSHRAGFCLGPVPRRLRRALDPPPCQLPHAAANDGDSVRTSRTNAPWFVRKRCVTHCWRQAGNAAGDDRRATGPAGRPDPGCNARASPLVIARRRATRARAAAPPTASRRSGRRSPQPSRRSSGPQANRRA
jgi:hypothetical protein